MSQQTMEERVAWLEVQVGRLLRQRGGKEEPARLDPCGIGMAAAEEPGPDDWKTTVGMFRGDPVFQEMIDEAVRRREQERRDARGESERESA
jgi:hypothetical protein